MNYYICDNCMGIAMRDHRKAMYHAKYWGDGQEAMRRYRNLHCGHCGNYDQCCYRPDIKSLNNETKS